jgi:membrane protein insertase Oxa1/YidC/SpoIIIJ
MDKKDIIKLIGIYVAISFIINYFLAKKEEKKNNNSIIVRMDNKKLISNKPVDIDITLLEKEINKNIKIDSFLDIDKDEFHSISDDSNHYTFSSFFGAPVIYKYKQSITKNELVVFDYLENKKDFCPLSILIDGVLITDFKIDYSLIEKDSITFFKKLNGFKIIRKYILREGFIDCEIEIDNPNNNYVGSISIVSQEDLLLKKDENEGAFTYNEEEKIVKFVSQNDLILDQSVIFNPEIVGLQSNFFVQAIIQNDSFYRSYFKKDEKNSIIYFLESKKNDQVNYKLSFKWYMGPKIYSNLDKVDSRLSLVMEYGWFSKISQYFLLFIFFLTSLFNSFGLALITFTAMTKVLIIPFASRIREKNKKTKEFQQKLDYVKAKYHDDLEKKSVEEAALFKKYGMFPGMSSKIPQIFNLFVVVSLQSVLKKTIMLYEVPIGLWLTDATMPDKYYVLPFLFLFFMYLNINNTKMSPMIKISLLMIIIFIIYMFTFWSSSIQLFIVMGVIAGYLENKYLLL